MSIPFSELYTICRCSFQWCRTFSDISPAIHSLEHNWRQTMVQYNPRWMFIDCPHCHLPIGERDFGHTGRYPVHAQCGYVWIRAKQHGDIFERLLWYGYSSPIILLYPFYSRKMMYSVVCTTAQCLSSYIMIDILLFSVFQKRDYKLLLPKSIEFVLLYWYNPCWGAFLAALIPHLQWKWTRYLCMSIVPFLPIILHFRFMYALMGIIFAYMFEVLKVYMSKP